MVITYISQCMIGKIDNCYQMNISFHFWVWRYYFSFNFIKHTARFIYFCADFDPKTGRSDFGYFCQISVAMIPQLTALKIKQANCFFSHFNCFYLLYVALNLRHKCVSDIHCGKQTKLSKTTGVPIRHNGRNN